MKIIKLSSMLLLVSLVGCATMSKDECRNADWYIQGLDDASEGYGLDRIGDHSRACARVNVIPNVRDYEAGHKKGARLYCVPGKGYSLGRQGAQYNGICPRELEDNFLRAYREGQQLYAIQQNINALANDINNSESRIDANYQRIGELKRQIVDRDSGSHERHHRLRQIDELQYEITELEVRIDRALREVELFKHDFRIVEDEHYRMGYLK